MTSVSDSVPNATRSGAKPERLHAAATAAIDDALWDLMLMLAQQGLLDAVCYDLWKTLGRGPYPEPIRDLQELLNLAGKVDDTEFLVTCLTTPHKDPARYLRAIASKYKVPVPDGVEERFAALVRSEIAGVWIYDDVLEHLKAIKALGLKVALITNSWPFPVAPMLERFGLDGIFDVIVSSSDENVQTAKQQGGGIYEKTCALLGVAANRCLMIGDNPKLDIDPAREAGLHTILIDREGNFHDGDGRCTCKQQDDTKVPAIKNLRQLHEAIVTSRKFIA